MEHEELDRLLAEYATGGLSEEDKKTLFTAALADQELFEQLMEEDALREAIELPGARNRLIDSLQEDLVMAEKAMVASAAAPSVLRMPSPASPQPKREPERAKPNWLAWAAGIGIVFVSGAITYIMPSFLDRGPTLKDIAQVYDGAPKDTKPFVQPPAPAAAARKVIVEEPPKIMADARKPMPIARPIAIPLPSAPPPAEPIVAEKETKGPEAVRSARAERDRSSPSDVVRTDQQRMAALPSPAAQPQAPAAAPATMARRQAPGTENLSAGAGALGGMAKTEEAREAKAKVANLPPSVWRTIGDGVWVRVSAADTISRTDIVTVRYTPGSNATVALLDPNGRPLANKPGRAGVELDLLVPPGFLQRATGDSITVSITEGPRSTFLKILLRNQ